MHANALTILCSLPMEIKKKKLNIILHSDMTDAGAITTVFQLERKRTITPEQHKCRLSIQIKHFRLT